jgi:phosphatidylglycerol:prolipoprotein diacylglycerol transferase
MGIGAGAIKCGGLTAAARLRKVAGDTNRRAMSFLTLPYPVIDPVAFEIGPLAVRWYGLAYMTGLLFGWIYVRAMLANAALWRPGTPPMPPQKTEDILLWITVGIVAGGRLGHVLFYEPGYYFADPLRILFVWEGGMSFHGGLLGVIFAVWLFARVNKVPMLSIADLACAATPVGIFCGRLANFINGELYGRVTDVPWAMVFPDAGPYPRHPSQLYEAVLEGLVVFLLCRYATHWRQGLATPGLVTGVFFASYGVGRSIAELYRLPDPDHALSTAWTTPGIVYSLPMILVGAWLIWRALGNRPAAA